MSADGTHAPLQTVPHPLTTKRYKHDVGSNHVLGAEEAMATTTLDYLHEHRLFTTLDGMRFVAALLVVTRHVPPVFGDDLFPENYLAVDLFFVLSGFVIANAYERKLLSDSMSVLTFLRIRAIRLYPLYLLGITLGVSASLVAHSYSPVRLAYHSLASLLLIPNPDGLNGLFPLDIPAWSLFLEASVNVVYVLALRWLVGGRLILVIAAAALALVAIEAVLHHNLNVGWTLRTLPLGSARVAFSFYVGVLIHRFHARLSADNRRSRSGNAVPLLLVACVAAVLTCRLPAFLAPSFEIVVVTCLFPSIVLAGIQFQPTGGSAQAFRLGGLLSYAIYVIHAPLSALVLAACQTVPGVDVQAHPIWAGFAFTIGLVSVCFAVDAFYDAPLRRALGRVSHRGPRQTPYEDH
jgi:peptidoglycan/LPS O-acetylase OafA/YrhL